MKKYGYYVEQKEKGLYQSVFPPKEADFSQLHATIEDAQKWITECVGKVKIGVVANEETRKGEKHWCLPGGRVEQ